MSEITEKLNELLKTKQDYYAIREPVTIVKSRMEKEAKEREKMARKAAEENQENKIKEILLDNYNKNVKPLFDKWKNQVVEHFFGRNIDFIPYKKDTEQLFVNTYDSKLSDMDNYLKQYLITNKRLKEASNTLRYTNGKESVWYNGRDMSPYKYRFEHLRLYIEPDNTPYGMDIELRPDIINEKHYQYTPNIYIDDDVLDSLKEVTDESERQKILDNYIKDINTNIEQYISIMNDCLKNKLIDDIVEIQDKQISIYKENISLYKEIDKDLKVLTQHGYAKEKIGEFFAELSLPESMTITINNSEKTAEFITDLVMKPLDELMDIYYNNCEQIRIFNLLTELKNNLQEEKFSFRYHSVQDRVDKEIVPIIQETIEMIQEWYNGLESISHTGRSSDELPFTCDNLIEDTLYKGRGLANGVYSNNLSDSEQLMVVGKLHRVFPLGFSCIPNERDEWNKSLDIYMPDFENWLHTIDVTTAKRYYREAETDGIFTDLEHIDEDIDKIISALNKGISEQKQLVIKHITERINKDIERYNTLSDSCKRYLDEYSNDENDVER